MKKYEMKSICSYCEKEYIGIKSNIKKAINNFCSRRCYGLFRRTRAIVDCDNCGVGFEKLEYWIKRSEHNFCCHECAMEFGRVKVECINCGKVFNKMKSQLKLFPNSFCDKQCYGEYRRRDDAKDRGQWKDVEWKRLVKERDGYICQICGTDEVLQVHHIYSWQNFPDKRFEIENGITLCRTCHWETHKKYGMDYAPVEINNE